MDGRLGGWTPGWMDAAFHLSSEDNGAEPFIRDSDHSTYNLHVYDLLYQIHWSAIILPYAQFPVKSMHVTDNRYESNLDYYIRYRVFSQCTDHIYTSMNKSHRDECV